MELEPKFKELVQELGHAINDSLAESEKIADVLGRIREAGFDLFLVLEVTVGFNRQGKSEEAAPTGEVPAESKAQFRITNTDAQFLRALRISVEEDQK